MLHHKDQRESSSALTVLAVSFELVTLRRSWLEFDHHVSQFDYIAFVLGYEDDEGRVE